MFRRPYPEGDVETWDPFKKNSSPLFSRRFFERLFKRLSRGSSGKSFK